MAKHNETGHLGEDLAAKWLIGRGLSIIDRNYSRKWGEIDIVARETDGRLHFVEVKTVSYETEFLLKTAVSRGTWRPEENAHRYKQERLSRAIQTWLAEHNEDSAWQIDVLALRVVPREMICSVKYLPNLIFE